MSASVRRAKTVQHAWIGSTGLNAVVSRDGKGPSVKSTSMNVQATPVRTVQPAWKKLAGTPASAYLVMKVQTARLTSTNVQATPVAIKPAAPIWLTGTSALAYQVMLVSTVSKRLMSAPVIHVRMGQNAGTDPTVSFAFVMQDLMAIAVK